MPKPAAHHEAETLSTPAYARVRERLRQEILAGDWPAGEHRTLAQLGARHGLSLSPIREALLHLQGEGLVELRQHRGAVVPLLDAALLTDLYDLRAALQSLQARRAAERATAAELARMAEHVAGFADAAGRDAVDEALAHNDAFHTLIDAAARNPQASAVYRARSAFVNTARRRLGYGPGRMGEADAQHRALLAAITAREAETAARLAFEHAQAARRDLIARLEQSAG